MPWASDLMEVVDKDLETSRALLTRLLGLSDALLATTVTVGGLFVGIAATTRRPAIAFIGVPVMLALTYADGLNWAQFRRVAYRIRSLEKLYQSYVVAIRERATVRAAALRAFERNLDRYEYGIERQLRSPGFGDVWQTNKTRFRWWLLVAFSISPLVIGVALTQHDDPAHCIELADGSIVQTSDVASVVGGSAQIVPCPGRAPSDLPQTPATTAPSQTSITPPAATASPSSSQPATTSTTVR